MTQSQTQPPVHTEIEELETFVLEELRHHHIRDNIILKICQRTDWDWQQAQQFLDKVYVDHRAELASREKRFALAIGLTRILEGLAVFVIGGLGIVWWLLYNPRSGQWITSADYPIVVRLVMMVSMAPAYFTFFAVIAATGIGMMTKGVLVVIRTIK